MNLFENAERLLRIAVDTDAWIANRRLNYSSIEGSFPIIGSRAKGAYVWDVDNNKYIDYTMGYGTVLLGHADDRVNQAVIKEIERGTCISPMWKDIQIELGVRLKEIIPNAEQVFFMKTGSDATSGAVRLARCFTNRDLVLRWGYNGWHDWATPRPMGVPDVIQKDVYKFSYGNLNDLESIFEEHKNQIACVIMMPFELEFPPVDYLNNVKEIVHKNGALFILDEMRSGFRVAPGGAQEYFHVEPDLATYSKAMANGFPISAITGRADIFKNINNTKMTATYFGSSHEMAAALKTIELVKTTNVIAHIWKLGDYFIEEMKKIISNTKVRCTMIGTAPMPYMEFDYGELSSDKKKIFYGACAERGILFHPNHHWYISGAHSKQDIDETLCVCEEAFRCL